MYQGDSVSDPEQLFRIRKFRVPLEMNCQKIVYLDTEQDVETGHLLVLTEKTELSSYLQVIFKRLFYIRTIGKEIKTIILLPGKIIVFFSADTKNKTSLQNSEGLIVNQKLIRTSVGDPDLHVFGPPGSGSISQRH